MPAADKEALTIEPWAMRIGLAAVVLVASTALFTAWDRAHTGALEAVVAPTAVGDTHYVPEPPGGNGPTGLKYQGQPLDMVSESKVRDAMLIEVGVDDSGVYSLYRPADPADALPKGSYYMKVKTNEFIEVSAE
jgi:hypothetical protein